ncbi:STM4012 family radical SAM protein [Planosporangium sp. 12N6]|uniref:STM4012 family radical SAM protein n=1 Tax=Planosporangium spinosum TaxID=3402278 RepID=UPI003CEA5C35
MTLDGSPYQGYLYAYPHKTAYRPLEPRPALRDVWAAERRDALFLYLHVPFCEMRCGFCNLFTRSNPPAEQVAGYLRQLRRQAERVSAALGGDARFVRAAFGGGTPTYLTAGELDDLFDIAEQTMGAALAGVPVSVETSPATATPDRLAVLAARGTTRVSMGVQSFLDTEAHAAGRPQRRAEVERALGAIRAAGVPVLNLDLIYGIDGQTARTWQASLDAALAWRPEELYLYPLYVRPLTGLGRRAHSRADWDDQRMALYRQAVEVLGAAGYRQESMRQFRRADVPAPDGPDYCCQDDGMVGLGCGARSYTTALHYSFDYAVSVSQVRAVLDDYLARPASDFGYAEVGYRLDEAEQRRRWLITSLLRADGLDPAAYRARFGTGHLDDLPQLAELARHGWATDDATRLTADGLARSDLIGPWLVSGPVRHAMDGYALR